MQLHFVPTESAFAYFEATRAYLEEHGKPVAFYSDKAGIFRAARESPESGRSITQYANSSQAKGRVEGAHLRLQGRLVKELRPMRWQRTSLADFNARFAKPPWRDFQCAPTRARRRGPRPDLHLAAAAQSLCVAHAAARPGDLPARGHAGPPKAHPPLHRCPGVSRWRIELGADGVKLPYERYDRLPQIEMGAIVENKRLSHALQAALVIQAQRDDRHISNTPSRTNQGRAPYSKKALPGTKRSRQITPEDLAAAVMTVSTEVKKSSAPTSG